MRTPEENGVETKTPVCFCCGDAESPRSAVLGRYLCGKCQELMTRYVILIRVRDGESGENPFRSGRMCVVTDNYIRKHIKPRSLCDEVLRKRTSFVPDSAWTMLGLPNEVLDSRA